MLLVVPGRLRHALALRRVAIAAIYCVHIRVPFKLLLRVLSRWLVDVVFTRHWRLANISFRLTEEKVLVRITSDLQVHDVAHIFEIFKLMMKLFFIIIVILFLFLI